MTQAADLRSRLDRLGIWLEAHEGRLRLGPTDRLTPELLAEVQRHKPALLAMLRPEVDAEREAIQWEAEAPAEAVAFPFGSNTHCLVHLDPTQWEEKPTVNRPGWLRTTCKRCGTFIGYRPEGDMA